MNVVIFGATQSGKSTLAGYIAASTQSDTEFNQSVLRNKRYIDDMEVGGFKQEMVYTSFVSMDRDELRRSAHQNTIGTTKHTHRKRIIAKDTTHEWPQKLILIDTPGVRSCVEGRYTGIFEGDVGICLLSATDLTDYAECVSSNWVGTDKQKKFLYDKRLFDAIRFWCIYKNSNSLVIAISKVDKLDYNSSRIQQLSELVSSILEEYGIQQVPIVPIAVQLDGNLGNYVRHEYNVFRPGEKTNTDVISLVPLAFSKGKLSKSNSQKEIFASVNRLCKIKNGSGHALRVKVLSGTISSSSKLIIGPVRTRADETVRLTGPIKSLKEEDDVDTTERLTTGTIGGAAFSYVCIERDIQHVHSSLNTKRWDISDFRMLKTTILTDAAIKEGDAVELIVADEELNESARLAMENILPKDAIRFLWFGKKLLGHVIALYEKDSCWHMLLYNINPEYRKANGPFIVPLANEKGILDIECPVILQLPRWYTSSATHGSPTTFLDFSLKDLYTINWSKNYTLKVAIEDECAYQQEDVEAMLEMSVTLRLNGDTYTIEASHVTKENMGKILRTIRKFIRDEGICKYALYFEEGSN